MFQEYTHNANFLDMINQKIQDANVSLTPIRTVSRSNESGFIFRLKTRLLISIFQFKMIALKSLSFLKNWH